VWRNYDDGLDIDLGHRIVETRGKEVPLSRTQWELPYQLASNAGRVMRHIELLYLIWISRHKAKPDPDHPEDPIIQTHPVVCYRLIGPE
jgi:DNA-binding response OmpR family regulator